MGQSVSKGEFTPLFVCPKWRGSAGFSGTEEDKKTQGTIDDCLGFFFFSSNLYEDIDYSNRVFQMKENIWYKYI